MRERHIVPLSTQAVALLRELRSVTRKSRYLFPSLQSRDWPMSVNTANAALRRLGYARDEMTAHGFRAMACTCLNELGWHPDLIELQLAHAERHKVRAAYNRAERLADRRKMMQAWADYLDGLRGGSREVSSTADATSKLLIDAVDSLKHQEVRQAAGPQRAEARFIGKPERCLRSDSRTSS